MWYDFGFEILDFFDNLDSENLKYGLIKLTTFWRPLKFHWVNFDLTIKAQIEIICLILYFVTKRWFVFYIKGFWNNAFDFEGLKYQGKWILTICFDFESLTMWTNWCSYLNMYSVWNLIVICFDNLRIGRILNP